MFMHILDAPYILLLHSHLAQPIAVEHSSFRGTRLDRMIRQEGANGLPPRATMQICGSQKMVMAGLSSLAGSRAGTPRRLASHQPTKGGVRASTPDSSSSGGTENRGLGSGRLRNIASTSALPQLGQLEKGDRPRTDSKVPINRMQSNSIGSLLQRARKSSKEAQQAQDAEANNVEAQQAAQLQEKATELKAAFGTVCDSAEFCSKLAR